MQIKAFGLLSNKVREIIINQTKVDTFDESSDSDVEVMFDKS